MEIDVMPNRAAIFSGYLLARIFDHWTIVPRIGLDESETLPMCYNTANAVPPNRQ